MLVLSRKKGEKIVIGDGLATIEVVEIRGDKVRLGIVADKTVPVHREEILSRRPPETEAKVAT
jgi:carbon storage regulator